MRYQCRASCLVRCIIMLNAAPLFFSVLLNAQSIHTSSTCHAEQSEASTHWIPHCVRNDKKVLGTPPPCHAECCKASSLSQFVMLSKAKHPCGRFLTGVRNDKKVLGTPPPCHAECCKASSLSQFVMLSKAKHPRTSCLSTPQHPE
jgi:hypothetical protein